MYGVPPDSYFNDLYTRLNKGLSNLFVYGEKG